ncbi:MAG: ECF transporter S component [Lachnospiraceae bacterium]|nr:ECF transporter S component [Lachnospiraceae bacterium]MDD6619036.1 ECF transporter S component [Clostridiales bacterium]MDY4771946.1 ECF transporter S component [Lachnospiraceae bacterium]
MSEQVLRRGNVAEKSKVRTLAQIAMLGAVATVLMLFEFPIPFIAPPFYEMDFSEVPVLVGAFAMGPVAGIAIEAIKILLNFVINGTITAGVGELANFIFGCAFLLPAALIYRKNKTRKNAIIGMAIGTVVMTVAACIINALVLLPAYGAAFGMPVDAFVQMGTSINKAIDSLFTFAVLAVGPFNLIKGIAVSAIVLLIYKRIRVILKGDL